MAHAFGLSALLIVLVLQLVIIKRILWLLGPLRLLLQSLKRLVGFLHLEYIKCNLSRLFKDDQFLLH